MLLFLRAQTKAHPTTTNIGWRFHCRKNSFLLIHPFSLDWQFVEGRKEPDLYKIWNGSDNDFLWIIERDAFIHWWLHLLWKHITIEGRENIGRHTYSVVLKFFVERPDFTKSLMSTKKQLNIIVNKKRRTWNFIFLYLFQMQNYILYL